MQNSLNAFQKQMHIHVNYKFKGVQGKLKYKM